MLRTTLLACLLLMLAIPMAEANRLLSDNWLSRASDDQVRLLIRNGGDPNSVKPRRGTLGAVMPLHIASHFGNLAALTALLEAGADPNGRGEPNGRLPLHYAADAEIVHHLIDSGADPNLKGGQRGETPLHFAVYDNRIAAIEALIRRGANLQLTAGKYGDTPLHYAAEDARTRAIEVLIRLGADINALSKNDPQVTPLWLAARYGDATAVRLLLEAGADVHAASPDGRTALYVAARDNSRNVVRLLLDAGADPTTITDKGKTAASVADKNWRLGGTPEIAELKAAVVHLRGTRLKPLSTTESCKDGYIVQPGDVRLGIIAEKTMGNYDRWIDIARLNDISPDNPYRQGQCLKLPVGE